MTQSDHIERLEVPLSKGQIEAAVFLHSYLLDWEVVDASLRRLREDMPGFTNEESLLKVVAVNQLYGTRVMAIHRMARHVTSVMAGLNGSETSSDLVLKLASPESAPAHVKDRRHLSFASKFAHFFISEDEYMIFDRYAVWTTSYHVGRKARTRNPSNPYEAFVHDARRVIAAAGFDGRPREFDWYLWLRGLYDAADKDPQARINVEFASLFRNDDQPIREAFKALVSG